MTGLYREIWLLYGCLRIEYDRDDLRFGHAIRFRTDGENIIDIKT